MKQEDAVVGDYGCGGIVLGDVHASGLVAVWDEWKGWCLDDDFAELLRNLRLFLRSKRDGVEDGWCQAFGKKKDLSGLFIDCNGFYIGGSSFG